MPAKRLSRQEQKAATRAALVRSAAAVIARRGFHDAFVDEIAENAGYSVGALYSNFASKEELLLAAAEDNQAHWASLFMRRFEEGTGLQEQVTTIARDWMEGVSATPELFLLWVELWSHAVRNGPPLREELAARSRRVRSGFAEMARASAGQVGTELDEEQVAQLAALADAAGIGFGMIRLLDPEAVPDGMFETVSVLWLSSVLEVLAAQRASRDVRMPLISPREQ
jgi:AcrR family transcriptional regulator